MISHSCSIGERYGDLTGQDNTLALYRACSETTRCTTLFPKHVVNVAIFSTSSDPCVIIDELDSVYGNSAPSFTTGKAWAAEFKRGRKSLGNIERSRRPNTATTDENIAKVHQMVLDDR
ncbi:HTH_48 domain-containing protein [Trichonephila clavipes]|nr:HTH_48 domain-containing protein [Trichonephila clavipes]